MGSDLVSVFTTTEAAMTIKSYSPELMVLPCLRTSNSENEAVSEADAKKIIAAFPRLNALVVGPGLGLDPQVLATVRLVVLAARRADLPLIIDADGLQLVNADPALVAGYSRVVLTPNAAEFRRLWIAVFGAKGTPPDFDVPSDASDLLADTSTMISDPDTLIESNWGLLSVFSRAAREAAALATRLGGVTVLRKGQVAINLLPSIHNRALL
jgi:NAD(P)H-hydrate repair Nnr-like enzyme with NAD(P)H-hydrate dehydratase domain